MKCRFPRFQADMPIGRVTQDHSLNTAPQYKGHLRDHLLHSRRKTVHQKTKSKRWQKINEGWLAEVDMRKSSIKGDWCDVDLPHSPTFRHYLLQPPSRWKWGKWKGDVFPSLPFIISRSSNLSAASQKGVSFVALSSLVIPIEHISEQGDFHSNMSDGVLISLECLCYI